MSDGRKPMTDSEWLSECASHAAQSYEDRGGAPMEWMAEAARKQDDAIAKFGEEAFNAEYERWRDFYRAQYNKLTRPSE